MNPFEFALGIILIGAVVFMVRASSGRERRLERDPEAERLQDEVEMLRDRIAVLERITVEKENSLERQIEALRDR
jgi:uncharacterized membrane protein